MSKCKCGNELGKPLVSPNPISFVPHGKKNEVVYIYYMAGFDQHGQCWFCAFPRREGWMNG
jgi:hypothetical protein